MRTVGRLAMVSQRSRREWFFLKETRSQDSTSTEHLDPGSTTSNSEMEMEHSLNTQKSQEHVQK